MKQAKQIKRWRYYLRRFAYQIKILRVLQSISREKYDEKVSASLVYGFLSAVAVNFFFNQDTFTQVARQVWHRLSLPWVITGLVFIFRYRWPFMLSIFRWWFWLGIRLGISLQSLPLSQYPWVPSLSRLYQLWPWQRIPSSMPFLGVLSWAWGLVLRSVTIFLAEVQISSVSLFERKRVRMSVVFLSW